jgi:hypothetical protein
MLTFLFKILDLRLFVQYKQESGITPFQIQTLLDILEWPMAGFQSRRDTHIIIIDI